MTHQPNMSFSDHFSGVADDYARYRPVYPEALFDWLARRVAAADTAVDVACGSGQATLPLAARFETVVGVDASRDLIRNAPTVRGVTWKVARAEATGLADASADLVIAAQAAHWFDHDAFAREVRRILRPGGVVAVWCYGLFHFEPWPGLEGAVRHFHDAVVGPYWPPERAWIEEGYRSLPFPFAEQAAPVFSMRGEYTRESLLGYLGTWSAVKRYRAANGSDPLPALDSRLAAAWPDDTDTVTATWPLWLRTGRID